VLSRASLVERIAGARRRIEPHVRETYLEPSPYFSELTGANIFFKCENLQITGSFKLRGATNRFLTLPDTRRRNVVAASTGNHGRAVAYVVERFGGSATIFVPANSDKSKIAAIDGERTTIRVAGDDCIEAEAAARAFADEHGQTYISPYNDAEVVAGQGVVGAELCTQLDRIDVVYASVGGGGLISGIGAAVKSRFPDCRIVGCSPERSKVMVESLAAGRVLDLPSQETLSDGTAGGVEHDSITFDLCRELIDECMVVSEEVIRTSLSRFLAVHGMLIEGAAAVSVACLTRSGDGIRGKNVVVVLCGRNIGLDRLATVIRQEQEREQVAGEG
jgi:threonine dehydratase